MKKCRTYNGLITALRKGEPAILKIVGKQYNSNLETYMLKLPSGKIERVNMSDGWGFIQRHLVLVEPTIETNKKNKSKKAKFRYKPIKTKEGQPFEELLEIWNKNQEQLKALDEKAKKANSIVGRYINIPMGDGYSYYQVTSLKKNNARLELVTFIGDDWIYPLWGKAAMVSLSEVKNHISRRDSIERLSR